ncbi:Sodium-dependent nutrient amino acid transporter 1 [Folsomia candida]|uniref:Sodium-dependent nutrient amino acid transporter 1 n=2 Tax=Folsomia candida TaxID=158441 RepID=A0A226DD27_FOLCA|nr:Sodium-dependent nutrient amino acid transporter 1 [Folsomia candida]
MYASYNPFRHNVYRDAMIVSLIDTGTSLLAGFTVFSILGNLAHETGAKIENVAKSGPGLVFVSYADAIGKFDQVPQLFSTLFFLMLFSLGVGSAVSWQMAVITVICDQFPKLKKLHVTMATCGACFLLGLIYVTPGGQQVLTLVDNFSGNFVIYILATLEVMAISWVYGLSNIVTDFEFMLGQKIGIYWKFCWGFFVPVFLFLILIYSLVTMETVEYNGVPLPGRAIAAGWVLASCCLIFVPIFAFIEIFKNSNEKLTLLEKVKSSLTASSLWGPKSPKERALWENYVIENKSKSKKGSCFKRKK